MDAITRPKVQVWSEYGGATLSDIRDSISAWADLDLRRLISALTAGDPILFRFSEAELSAEAAVEAAQLVAQSIVQAVGRETRMALEVEVEKPLVAKIHTGWSTRDMLPHHDAHHRSFLSPSVLDSPGFDVACRRFSSPASVPTSNTILYSGFVVSEVGDAGSITTFFDWFGIVRQAFRRRFGESSVDSRKAVSDWLADNIMAAYRRARLLDIEYLSTGAALGLSSPEYAFSVVEAEASFGSDRIRELPEFGRLTQKCWCADCDTPGKRLVCNALHEAIGSSLPQTLDIHGAAVESARNDYLLWCNPRLLHGAVKGGAGRKLVPVTVVTNDDRAPAYERWLSDVWATQFC
ncbi:hypothetical protein [Nocardia beijingensis]